MSWYKRSMPTIKDLSSIITQVCGEIKAIAGVKDVYLYGSYAENINNPNHIVKDVDIIASTSFHSGDLLAIDNGKYSALRIHPEELEDEGFNPKAVAFTKKFLAYEKYNVDHWAISKDNKLIHWGAIPDTTDEWNELHIAAEKRAQEITGSNRQQLLKTSDDKRKEWKQAYDQYISLFIKSKSAGWCLSSQSIEDVIAKAKKWGENEPR